MILYHSVFEIINHFLSLDLYKFTSTISLLGIKAKLFNEN